MPLLLIFIPVAALTIGMSFVLARRTIVAVDRHHALVVSGRESEMRDPISGESVTRNYRVVTSGSTRVLPILERTDHISLEEMSIQINSTDLRDASGHTREMGAVVKCHISSEPILLERAIVRFLGMEIDAIEAVVSATIDNRIISEFLKVDLTELFLAGELTGKLEKQIRFDLEQLGVCIVTMCLTPKLTNLRLGDSFMSPNIQGPK